MSADGLVNLQIPRLGIQKSHHLEEDLVSLPTLKLHQSCEPTGGLQRNAGCLRRYQLNVSKLEDLIRRNQFLIVFFNDFFLRFVFIEWSTVAPFDAFQPSIQEWSGGLDFDQELGQCRQISQS